MSKRGGASEVNGFISIGADSKNPKKKDGTVPKKESEEAVRRRTEPNKEQTPSRARVTKTTSKKEPSTSMKAVSEKREIKSKTTDGKSKSSSTNKVERSESIKKEASSSSKTLLQSPVNRSSKTQMVNEKYKTTSKELPKTYSSINKVKESLSSSHISSKGTKLRTAQSTPQLKKTSLVPGQSRDSPYRSSILEKTRSQTDSHASGDRLRKTSQLKDTPLKAKGSSSNTSSSKTNKKLIERSSVGKTVSTSSSLKRKPRREVGNKLVKDISEESDTESQQQLRPYGEVPRSNTFTKEGAAPDSLISDLSASSSAPNPPDSGDLDDLYDDDFEDYESDFEEYMESEDSSSSSDEEDDSSDSESFDEDEIGDGYKVGPTKPSDANNDLAHEKTNSNQQRGTDIPSGSTKLQNTNEKEKPSNVEEEKKLDSGSYDLTSHADLKRRKQIQDIRAAIDRENASFSAKSRVKSGTVAEDEGFVEICSQDTSPALIDTSYSPDKGLINFENARKQQKTLKAKAKVKKRGALLMEMIKLDVMSFKLLDIPSVPYEVYMQCYGRSNSVQMHSQTNEDDASVEVQTEDVATSTKWTQHPIKYSSPNSPDDLLFTYSQEKLGVGCESALDEKENWFPKLHVNSLRLHNFINNAGEMILTLLEENERDRKVEVSRTNKRDFGFSDSFISLNVQKMGFLSGRPVSLVCFSESNSSHLLTVHKPSTEPLTIQAESEGRCILCTWSIREPSRPLQILVASNDVSSVCYHSYLVIAGLIDGALCLWDLREQSVVHARCYLKEPDWLLRSPTYITADLEKRKRHSSSVVSIKTLPESNPDDSAKTTTDKTPSQVVSVDEDGLLAVWTVVESRSIVNINSGLAPWGKVRIVQSSQLRVLKTFPKLEQSGVQCRCLAVDRLKPSNLYIGTNTGQVIHSLQSSCRTRPQFYSSQSGNGANGSITCIEFSRCGYPLLMVGDSTGKVQIYRTMTERPLLDLSTSDVTPGPVVKCLQWSPNQPGLFFVLDSNSCVHVWDLCSSDMCPQMSVPFKSNKITCISITPHPGDSMLAVASETGTVDVYNLKDEYGSLPKKTSDEQHHIFSHYITIL